MHGLINRAIQCFVLETYDRAVWDAAAQAAGLGPEGFEAMLVYDDALTDIVLDTLSSRLHRPRGALLEDLGTFLVAHPKSQRVRRLLRFGGDSFVEFLHSLDDLPGRARLAVPDLELPELELTEEGPRTFCLSCRWHIDGAAQVMAGILRAMADDYGALVMLEGAARGKCAALRIELLDLSFAEGRHFALAARGA